MPGPIAAALATWWAGVAVTAAQAPLWATIAGYAIASAAFTAVSYGLGRIFQARAPSFSTEATERTHIVRSAIQPRRIAYGESVISGALIYHRSTSGDAEADTTNHYALKVFEFTEAGAASIVLYALQSPTEDDLVIVQNSTFTLNGQLYTVTANATAVASSEGDSYKIELSINPVLQADAAQDAAITGLTLDETIEGAEGKKHQWYHLVIALCEGPIQEIGDVFFNDKIAHLVDIVESIVSITRNITSSSAADPTVITTTAAHALISGDWIRIANHVGSTPSLNGIHQITRLTTITFSIPVEVTVGGTGGTLYRLAQVRTPRPHSYTTEDEIWIQNHTGSNPDINGSAIGKQAVYYVSPRRYAIDVNLTTGGTAGTCYLTRFYDGADPVFAICKHLGAADQPVCARLQGLMPEWDATKTLNGIAYLDVSFKFVPESWPNGIPNVKARILGKADICDPRLVKTVISSSVANPTVIACTGHGLISTDRARISGHTGSIPDINGDHTITKINNDSFTIPVNVTTGGTGGTATKLAYSNNWELCVRDALQSPYLLNCPDDELNDALAAAEASICDENVDLFPDYNPATAYIVGDFCVATNVVYENIEPCTGQSPPNTIYWKRRDELAATQKRYTCDGTFTLDSNPRDIISGMCTAAAARLPVWCQGKYHIYCASYRTPALSLDAGDLRGPVQIRPRIERQELFNAVKGVFTDPEKSWQPTSFPAVVNHLYEVQDGGVEDCSNITTWDSVTTYDEGDVVVKASTARIYVSIANNNLNHEPPDAVWWRDGVGQQIYKNIELPFVIDSIRAQRIAKIPLERSRQQITVVWPGKFKLYQAMPMDTVELTMTLLGWTDKVFQILSWEMAEDFGINLEMQEEAAAVYDWNYGDATIEDPAPDTQLPKTWKVPAPTNLALIERLYKDGNEFRSKIIATWDEAAQYDIAEYVVEGALQGTTTWYPIDKPTVPRCEIPNVPRGSYTIRVKAVTLYQCSSDWASANITVEGVYAVMLDPGLLPPIDPYLFIGQTRTGEAVNVRFQCRYKIGIGSRPHGIGLSYSVSNYENAVLLGADNGVELIIDEAEIVDSGQYGPILAGSTRTALVVATLTDPLPVDEGIDISSYWCQFSTSQWRKVSRYDETTMYFDEPFDIDPVVTAMINYRASGWVDNRAAAHRFLYVENGAGQYEIIKWGGIAQSADTIKFTGCTRAQEGTGQIDVSGLKAHHYPAIGPGDSYIVFPTASFREEEPGLYVAEASVNVTHPRAAWGRVSCMAYVETDQGYVRSYIVPCPYGGA